MGGPGCARRKASPQPRQLDLGHPVGGILPLRSRQLLPGPKPPYLARLCQYLDQVVLPKEDKVLMVPSWWSQLRQCPGTGRPLGGRKQGGCGSLDRPPTGVPTPPTSPTHHVHQPAHKLRTMPNISAKPLLNHMSKSSSQIYFEQI